MSDNIDKAAHDLMNFKPQKVTRVHGYEVSYHEERLYTVRDSNTGITSLVYAREPREAAEKVIKMTVEQPKAKNIGADYAEQDQFICSECGIHLQDWVRIDEDDYEDGIVHEYVFRFCPNCGKKLEEPDDEK